MTKTEGTVQIDMLHLTELVLRFLGERFQLFIYLILSIDIYIYIYIQISKYLFVVVAAVVVVCPVRVFQNAWHAVFLI